MKRRIEKKKGETYPDLLSRLKGGNEYVLPHENINVNALRMECTRKNKENRIRGENLRYGVSISANPGNITVIVE